MAFELLIQIKLCIYIHRAVKLGTLEKHPILKETQGTDEAQMGSYREALQERALHKRGKLRKPVDYRRKPFNQG